MSPSTRRDTISPSPWCRSACTISDEIDSGWFCIRPNILGVSSVVIARSNAKPARAPGGCSGTLWLEEQRHGGALPRARLDADGTVDGLHHALAEHEAHAAAAAGRARGDGLLRQLGQNLRRDAWAVVAHADAGALA